MSVHPSAPPVRQSRLRHIARRTLSIVSGAASIGLAVLLWNGREHIPDDWAAGFWWLYVFWGLLVVTLGAGAVVLWYPKGRSGPWRLVMRAAVAGMLALVGIILVAAVVLGSFSL